MANKKQSISAQARRERILEFFRKCPQQKFLIPELYDKLKKDNIEIKDESTLRRDLESLSKNGKLKKEKDNSQIPARSVYSFRADPETKKEYNKPVKEQKKNKEPKNSEKQNSLKGRPSARKLEADILKLIDSSPLSAQEIAEALQRQRPTIVKALERMQKRHKIKRKKEGRSFKYSPIPEGTVPVSHNESFKKTPTDPERKTKPETGFSQPKSDDNILDAILDRWLSAERRIWELEKNR